jgi:hypothetical protein
MDTNAIAAALQAEIARLSHALSILTGDAPVKRRGRPPKSAPSARVTSNGVATTAQEQPAKKKRTFSLAQRKAAADRARAMWAKKKAGTKRARKRKGAVGSR